MNTPVKQTIGTHPVDIATMRETASLLLGPEDEPDAPPDEAGAAGSSVIRFRRAEPQMLL
ncbi:hypothetical protein ACF09H_03650 [Streptomyces sp. NPDC014983]|uniref:hypothetical protein n=1 Tax=Streptomyces sp. NPDC014983 TaxID=3364933 RepID=UPI0036FC0799